MNVICVLGAILPHMLSVPFKHCTYLLFFFFKPFLSLFSFKSVSINQLTVLLNIKLQLTVVHQAMFWNTAREITPVFRIHNVFERIRICGFVSLITDQDSAPDPYLFSSGFQDVNKYY